AEPAVLPLPRGTLWQSGPAPVTIADTRVAPRQKRLRSIAGPGGLCYNQRGHRALPRQHGRHAAFAPARSRSANPSYLRGSPPMTAKIHIERMMHRSSIQVQGDSAATYALVKLIPSGSGGVQ